MENKYSRLARECLVNYLIYFIPLYVLFYFYRIIVVYLLFFLVILLGLLLKLTLCNLLIFIVSSRESYYKLLKKRTRFSLLNEG